MPVSEKKIWIQTRRIDLKDVADYSFNDDEVPLDPVREIRFSKTATSDDIKCLLRNACKINDENFVLKLRNHRGSLIIISSKLSTNSKSVPYILEVTRPHQTVKAKETSVSRAKHTEALKRTLRNYVARLEKLEFEVTSLHDKRNEKITQDMSEVDRKIEFLNKRIEEADTTKWKGMFKKNPLW